MSRSSSSESIPDAVLFSSDSSTTDRMNILVDSAVVEKSVLTNRNSDDDIQMPLRGYTKWGPSHGCTLVWRDVSVYANLDRSANNSRLKRIINNSSGAIQPGTLMALMGSRLGDVEF